MGMTAVVMVLIVIWVIEFELIQPRFRFLNSEREITKEDQNKNMTETRVGSASCGCEQKRWMVFVIMMVSCQSADEMELNGRDEERKGNEDGGWSRFGGWEDESKVGCEEEKSFRKLCTEDEMKNI